MKKYIVTTAVLLLTSINLYAAVPVGIIPFEGDDAGAQKAEAKVKEILLKTDGITIVADKQMDQVVKMHEKAQVVGSAYHDISKLKVAAFLITGNVTGNKLTLKAVDVNECTDIYSGTVDLSKENSQYAVRRTVKEITDKILLQSASVDQEIPSNAAPYMSVINKFVASLCNGDQASYPYMAVYLKGSYRHPDPDDKKSVDIAKLNLKVMRQTLNRAKVTYIAMKNEASWVYMDVVADKAGKKTKMRFGLLELDDGSIAIGTCDEGK